MPSRVITAQLLSRDAITAVIHRYAEAIDERSTELLLSCFADDATVEYAGIGEPLAPRQVAEMMVAEEGRARGVPGLDAIAVSTHIMSAIVIDFDGDGASARCTGMVYLGGTSDDSIVLVRSLRYVDRFVQTANGWRIQRREHRLRWSAEFPARAEASASWNPDSHK